ncbi:MAG: DsbA family protein [Aeromicrobium sp.]|uniref:DsbA family oxidoreductase n=1 Tax=Aeromicrobium sp. TaxID=1871063 RepID=UPI0039E45797
MKATLFVDVTDPWSFIGATRFTRAAATYTIVTGEPVRTTLRAHLLDPDVVSAGRPLMAALAERLGGSDQAELLNVRVQGAARISGIDLNFADAVEANSFDSWRLLTWADEAGPGVQYDLAQQLWRAHLLEGADIADHGVLATRAALVGLDLETAEALLASDEYADAVRAQHEASLAVDALDLGSGQLPGVVIDDAWSVSGLHSQHEYLRTLERVADERGR